MEKKTLSTYFRETESVRKNWGWFFVLGLLLVLLGGVVINSAFVATLFSMVFFGSLLLTAGIIQVVQAFMAREWSGLFLSLLLGVLYGVVGVLCIARPEQAAINTTLLIAAFCLVSGLFKVLTSLIMQFEQWGWVCFNGVITFILGLMIYNQWPLSGLWIIGLFVGVDMILSGWSWILLSLCARKHCDK
ncbi:MAG: DUF308 domain-containing protein [Verrucomicrobia bacterium]|nr:DUF308 domain-containing protein [Verrucomicrobiota bacterium]MBS0636699.1 DUF308 domain-containing protein [Verrucomicrobiota bacterium]